MTTDHFQRSSLAERWSRARRDILLSVLAASLSWWLATALFEHELALFAAMASVVALTPGVPRHSVQTVGMLMGVAVGVTCGGLVQLIPDLPSTLLIAAATATAMLAAIGLGLNTVMVVQSGAAAVLVIGSPQPDAGFARLVDALIGGGVALLFSQVLREADLVDAPAWLLFELTGGGGLGGHPGTVEGLLSHLRFLPDGPVEWSVSNKGGNVASQAALSIEHGGHLSVGLGDYGWPELGQPDNGHVVAFAAGLARAMGREVATVAQTRELLKL